MKLGRPRQFDYERALTKATEQFWSDGYASTSLQNLLDCMSLSKSSFYQSFGGKEKLFIDCLENYRANVCSELNKLFAEAGSGIAAIEILFESVINEANTENPRGCLLVNTANEIGHNETKISESVRRGFDEIRMVVRAALAEAQFEGLLSARTDFDELSDFLVSGVCGLRTLVKGGVSYERLQRVKDSYIDSVQ